MLNTLTIQCALRPLIKEVTVQMIFCRSPQVEVIIFLSSVCLGMRKIFLKSTQPYEVREKLVLRKIQINVSVLQSHLHCQELS